MTICSHTLYLSADCGCNSVLLSLYLALYCLTVWLDERESLKSPDCKLIINTEKHIGSWQFSCVIYSCVCCSRISGEFHIAVHMLMGRRSLKQPGLQNLWRNIRDVLNFLSLKNINIHILKL